MLKLGNIELKYPFLQAALSGYTDTAMRQLASEKGAPFTFTGLMLDRSTIHQKVLRKPEFQLEADYHPIGAQILGRKPETMAQAAAILEEMGFDLIDLNFACPAPKVLRRSRGGALLREPKLLREIYKQVRDTVKCPVTMKLRIGYGQGDQSQESFWQICDNAVSDGVDCLMIHGRTVLEKYRGNSNWQAVYDVKKKYPSMVIVGSGDVYTARDVKARLDTGILDGILIARGAIGNPWIFEESIQLLEGRDIAPVSIHDQVAMIRKHIELLKGLYVEKRAIPFFRKFAVHYAKRHPRRKTVMLAILETKTYQQLEDVLVKWYDNYDI